MTSFIVARPEDNAAKSANTTPLLDLKESFSVVITHTADKINNIPTTNFSVKSSLNTNIPYIIGGSDVVENRIVVSPAPSFFIIFFRKQRALPVEECSGGDTLLK